MASVKLTCSANVSISEQYTAQAYTGSRLAYGHGSGGDEYRLLLNFPSVTAALPSAAYVTAATLTVTKASGAIGSNAGFESVASLITKNWTESSTWDSGITINTAYDSAAVNTGDGHSGNLTYDVTDIVRQWMGGTAQRGIMLRAATTKNQTLIKVIKSRAAVLTITYSPASSFTTGGTGKPGDNKSITITAANDSYTHDLAFSIGGKDYIIASKKTASALTKWTIPAECIPNVTSAQGTLTLTTYNGNSQLGTYSKTVTVSVPDDAVPVVGSLSAAIVGNDVAAGWGVYVKGITKAKLTADSAIAPYGASVAKYSFSGGGWSSNSTTDNATSSFLATAGDITFTVIATDTRGRTSAPKTVVINVLDYSNPTLRDVSAARTDASGNSAPGTGTYITVSATLVPFDVGGKNGVKSLKATSSPALANVSDLQLSGATIDKSYTVTITGVDALGISVTTTRIVPAAQRIMNVTTDGSGVAIGGFADNGKFTSHIPAEFKGSKIPVAVDDTGWNAMGFTDAVSVSGSNYGRHENGDCYYRVINKNHVYVAFNCAFAYSGSAIYVNANQIPAAYRPKRNVYSMCAIGGRSMARVVVTSAGHLVIDWVQVISAGAATTSATVNWLDAYIDYWLE